MSSEIDVILRKRPISNDGHQLQKEINILTKEIQQQMTMIHEIDKKVEVFEDESMYKQQQNIKQQQLAQSSPQQSQSLSKRINQLQSHNTILRQQLQRLTSTISNYKKQFSSNKEQKQMLQQSIKELSERNHQLFEQLMEKDQIVVKLQSEINRIKDTMTNRDNHTNNNHNQPSQQENQNSNIIQNLQQENQNSNIIQHLQQTNKQNILLRQKICELQVYIQSLSQEISTLQSDNGLLLEDNHQLNSLIEQKVVDEDRLREDYQLLIKQNQYLQSKLQSNSDAYHHSQYTLQLEQKVQVLQDQLSIKNQQRQHLYQDISLLKAQLHNIKLLYEQQQDIIQKKTHQIKQLSSINQQLNYDINKLTHDNTRLGEDNATLGQDNIRLSEDNVRLSEDNVRLNQEVLHLCNQIEDLLTTHQRNDLYNTVQQTTQQQVNPIIHQQQYDNSTQSVLNIPTSQLDKSASQNCLQSVKMRVHFIMSPSQNKKQTLTKIKKILRTQFQPTPTTKNIQSLVTKMYIDAQHLQRVNSQLLQKAGSLQSQIDTYKAMLQSKSNQQQQQQQLLRQSSGLRQEQYISRLQSSLSKSQKLLAETQTVNIELMRQIAYFKHQNLELKSELQKCIDTQTEQLITQLTAQLETERTENRRNYKTIQLMEGDIAECEQELIRKDERIKYLGLLLSKNHQHPASHSNLNTYQSLTSLHKT